MSELRGEVSRLEAVKEELEKELDTQTNQMHKQVKGCIIKGSLMVFSLFSPSPPHFSNHLLSEQRELVLSLWCTLASAK